MIQWFFAKEYRATITDLEKQVRELQNKVLVLQYERDFAREHVKIREEELAKASEEVKTLAEKVKEYEAISPQELELRNQLALSQLQNELQSLNIERQKEVEDAFEGKPKKLA